MEGSKEYLGLDCGLSRSEWEREQVIDAIKAEPSTLLCIGILGRYKKGLRKKADKWHAIQKAHDLLYLELQELKAGGEKPLGDQAIPLALKAGDQRVLINGSPCKEDFRVISEDFYQKYFVGDQAEKELWEEVIERSYMLMSDDASSTDSDAETMMRNYKVSRRQF